MPYGLCQHWFSQWLAAWRHQAIVYADLFSIRAMQTKFRQIQIIIHQFSLKRNAFENVDCRIAAILLGQRTLIALSGHLCVLMRWSFGALLPTEVNWDYDTIKSKWRICASVKLTIIGSDNGLSPGRRKAIISTNAAILLIGSSGTNFSEISIEVPIHSRKCIFENVVWKTAAILSRPQCVK